MTQSMIDENVEHESAENDRLPVANEVDSPRRRSLGNFRGKQAEDIMGILADAIDYEFLETVLGCRGRKVPKEIGL